MLSRDLVPIHRQCTAWLLTASRYGLAVEQVRSAADRVCGKLTCLRWANPPGYHRLSGRAHPHRPWDGAAWGYFVRGFVLGEPSLSQPQRRLFSVSELPQKRLFRALNRKLDSQTHLAGTKLSIPGAGKILAFVPF
jgi:hypothetical protein